MEIKDTGLKITNIDFSDSEETLNFIIEHDDHSPECLWLSILRKYNDDDEPVTNDTVTLLASQMKALGKALVFAAEYVEGLYSKDGHNF